VCLCLQATQIGLSSNIEVCFRRHYAPLLVLTRPWQLPFLVVFGWCNTDFLKFWSFQITLANSVVQWFSSRSFARCMQPFMISLILIWLWPKKGAAVLPINWFFSSLGRSSPGLPDKLASCLAYHFKSQNHTHS